MVFSQQIIHIGPSDSKESAFNAGDSSLIPGSGRASGEGSDYLLQYCLENSMDRGAWQATVYGVTKSQTWLSDQHFDFPVPLRTSFKAVPRSYLRGCFPDYILSKVSIKLNSQILHSVLLFQHLKQEARRVGTTFGRKTQPWRHSKNWLEPSRSKMAEDPTSSGAWASPYVHCNMHALCALCTHVLMARLLCSWNFPGKDAGVGGHLLLQGIFLA